jgi:ribosomal protein S27AE
MAKSITQFGARCAKCGATYLLTDPLGTEVVDIRWNDKEREFDVVIKLRLCNMCGGPTGEAVRRLPLDIATHSQCKCGSTLDLGDYGMNKVGADFVLTAKYMCPQCGEKTVVKKLKHLLGTLWGDTKKIQVSATGVTYEKRASKE